jgi:hypothetical protein
VVIGGLFILALKSYILGFMGKLLGLFCVRDLILSLLSSSFDFCGTFVFSEVYSFLVSFLLFFSFFGASLYNSYCNFNFSNSCYDNWLF